MHDMSYVKSQKYFLNVEYLNFLKLEVNSNIRLILLILHFQKISVVNHSKISNNNDQNFFLKLEPLKFTIHSLNLIGTSLVNY